MPMYAAKAACGSIGVLRASARATVSSQVDAAEGSLMPSKTTPGFGS